MKKSILLALLLFKMACVYAQSNPFDVIVEPVSIPGLGGLQSFAVGQHDGKWLLIGGRLDGLHRRQPFAAFDVAGNNNQLIVVDPVNLQTWNAPLSSLSVNLQEQMSSTNMEFHQSGNYLYLIGGYGFNASSNSKITFDKLTSVNVPGVIDAIITGDPIAPYFRQIADPIFAVTGGHLKKINNTFYLLGGNRFDGNYNPNNNPTFTQVYTDAIRKFTIEDDGINLSFTSVGTLTDATNLHRRDYNAVPQILPDGSQGAIMFSGVFQPTANLPWLNAVIVDSVGYAVAPGFQQYYNHYHCPVLPLYSTSANEMHNVFFGGIAQYYESGGVLIQDNEVPFVNTIARVTRFSDGSMAEFKLQPEMPGYLGSGAEFIKAEGVPHFSNSVLKLDDFSTDTTLAGFIFGGINSSAPNIFFTNDGTQSSASNTLLKVYVVYNNPVGQHKLNEQSTGTLGLQIMPNPSDGNITARFNLSRPSDVKITISDTNGRLLEEVMLKNQPAGKQTYDFSLKSKSVAGTFLFSIETDYERAVQKLILR